MSAAVPPAADVVVAGGGPAALALAAACAQLRLRTVLVAPHPFARWEQTYGVWVDQLERAGLAASSTIRSKEQVSPGPLVAQSWSSVLIGSQGRGLTEVGRAYALLDNSALAGRFRDLAGDDLTVVDGLTRGAAPTPRGMVVGLASGRTIDATVVFDATGYPGALVASRAGRAPAWQVAHGIVGRFAEPPVPPGSCVLMDWRAPGAVRGRDGAPSFLYAMDLGDGRFLVEETVLAARQPPPQQVLADRLARRLEARGASDVEVASRETVRIPMGAVAPPFQRVVPFGASAGMIHPATGYSVGAALVAAPRVAAAVRQAIDRRAAPYDVGVAAWRAVWPSGRRRARSLEQFGLRSVLAMDRQQLDEFFDAFFSLPVELWMPYLDGGSLSQTARLMRTVFAAVSPGVRRRLMAGDARALAGLLG